MTKNIIETLVKLRKKAITTDSNFIVTCVIKDEFNNISTGANIELEDRTLGICAEGAAISQLISTHGYRHIKEIWIMGASRDNKEGKLLVPCGICLQRLAELTNQDTMVYSVSFNTHHITEFKFQDLFPYSNTFQMMYFPKTEHEVKPNYLLNNDKNIPLKINNLLKNCYTPDDKNHEAVILKTTKDNFFYGVYFSTCCFKADISALNMAMYNYLLFRKKDELIKEIFYTTQTKGICIHPEFKKYMHNVKLKEFVNDYQSK